MDPNVNWDSRESDVNVGSSTVRNVPLCRGGVHVGGVTERHGKLLYLLLTFAMNLIKLL